MIHWAGYGLGIIIAGFPVFTMRGLAFLARKNWRRAFANVAGGMGLLVFGYALLGGLAFGFARSQTSGDPSQKARHLAEAISCLMNCAAWTALLGIPAGLYLAVVVLRQRAA